MNVPTVYKKDICSALARLGVVSGDTVLVHSSLKSMGYVDGGAVTVIKAFLETLGDAGTLVMPTLIQKDFEHAYETWYLDKPSDTGYITEVFRTYPGVLRSDQATHSVAARGSRAEELTWEHTAYGYRVGAFGETAFCASSPWQKLYDWNAKILMLGVTLESNTEKHLLEYVLVNEALDAITDPELRARQLKRLRSYDNLSDPSVLWPFLDWAHYQGFLDEHGLILKTNCGNAEFLLFRARDSFDLLYEEIKRHPYDWYTPEMLQWFQECRQAGG